MKSILVAEDDLNFGTVLQRELQEEEYSVDLVRDGVEAILSFLSNAYDFVLMDVRMPRLNGIDALRIINKIKPQIPAIIFSGTTEVREMEEAVGVGNVKFLAKPFEIGLLMEEIKTRFTGLPVKT